MSDPLVALKPHIASVMAGKVLDSNDAEAAFATIMDGQATPAQIAAFLTALRMRGESVAEISAAARVIRARALPITAPAGAMDIVGTGGDGTHTLNISTATAFVTAACGVPVAKHGNRAVSSRSGMADVLGALGINLNAEFSVLERCLLEANLCFMVAPRHHLSFKYVGPVRAELGVRTIFNILGPLCNPAGVHRYLLGVYAPEWVRPIAETLAQLGCDKAWVVHGAGGMDELSTLGANLVCRVRGGKVTEMNIDPQSVGLKPATLEALRGQDSAYNAARLKALLNGEQDAYRDMVLFGTSAALVIAEKAESLEEGMALAAAAVDQGKALAVLDKLVAITNT
jgi:anthranilate phosphoribosyltransferase